MIFPIFFALNGSFWPVFFVVSGWDGAHWQAFWAGRAPQHWVIEPLIPSHGRFTALGFTDLQNLSCLSCKRFSSKKISDTVVLTVYKVVHFFPQVAFNFDQCEHFGIPAVLPQTLIKKYGPQNINATWTYSAKGTTGRRFLQLGQMGACLKWAPLQLAIREQYDHWPLLGIPQFQTQMNSNEITMDRNFWGSARLHGSRCPISHSGYPIVVFLFFWLCQNPQTGHPILKHPVALGNGLNK